MLLHTDGLNGMMDRLGFTGSDLMEKRKAWLANLGYTHDSVYDAEMAYLTAQGYTQGTLQDRWHAFRAASGWSDIKDFYNNYNPDPYAESVAVGMSFEGTVGSQEFADTGGGTWTAPAGVVLDNTYAWKGNTSVKFPGGSSKFMSMDVPTSATLNWGTAPLTIEMFFLMTAQTGPQNFYLVGHSFADVWASGLQIGATQTFNYIYLYRNGNSIPGGNYASFGPNGSQVDSQWHHLAVVKDETNEWRVYLNGVSLTLNTGSRNYAGNLPATSGKAFMLGGDGWYTGNNFAGYIDNFRVTPGVCRYYGATISIPSY